MYNIYINAHVYLIVIQFLVCVCARKCWCHGHLVDDSTDKNGDYILYIRIQEIMVY